MKEQNASSVDPMVDGTDLRPMSIDFFSRENKSEYNSNTHKKAKKTKPLLKNIEDDESMITDYIILSDEKDSNFPNSVGFIRLSQLVLDFENLRIVFNGSIIDHELPHEIRKKYFDLCSNSRSLLHERLLRNIDAKLAAEIISETTKILELIRNCELKTCTDNLVIWDKTLAVFGMLGMDVGFIHVRINGLLRLLWDSKKTVDNKRSGENVENN